VQWAEIRDVEERETVSSRSVTRAYIQEHYRKYEQVVLARLLLAQNQHRNALDLLDSILPRFERINRPWALIEISILKSMAYHALGDDTSALAEMERAVSLAEPEGFMRIFLDEGEPVNRILDKLRSRKTTGRDHLEKILAAFGEKPTVSFAVELIATQEEPLSEREREVLRLLDTSLSSTEIAEELVVSVNTVRSHVKRIYQKLNVHSRYQAIARAKEQHII
jgi:LuxR family maltose regulon positive regulatory protein